MQSTSTHTKSSLEKEASWRGFFHRSTPIFFISKKYGAYELNTVIYSLMLMNLYAINFYKYSFSILHGHGTNCIVAKGSKRICIENTLVTPMSLLFRPTLCVCMSLFAVVGVVFSFACCSLLYIIQIVESSFKLYKGWTHTTQRQ